MAFYTVVSFSIAELVHTSSCSAGPYSFTREVLGLHWSYALALAESLKALTTTSIIVVGIGSYLREVFTIPEKLTPLIWLAFFLVFASFNIAGARALFRFQMLATLLSLLILLLMYLGAIVFLFHNGTNSTIHHQLTSFPSSISSQLTGFSFPFWFFLGVEEIPMAAHETIDPHRAIPAAIIRSMLTLGSLCFMTLFFSCAIPPGPSGILQSQAPLRDSFDTILSSWRWSGAPLLNNVIGYILPIGLICSFHSFLFCTSQFVSALAIEGAFPLFLQNTTISILSTASISFMLCLVVFLLIGETRLGAMLITLSLIGAICSYIIELYCFIVHRRKTHTQRSHYQSPLGVWGALIALCFGVFALLCTIIEAALSNEIIAIICAVLYFTIGNVYQVWATRRRHSLEECE